MSWNTQTPGAWKTPLPTQTKKNESSFPGLKGPETNDKIEYEELQQNEVLALEAIYGEDFVMHNTNSSAWKVSCQSSSFGAACLALHLEGPLNLCNMLT